MTRLESTRCTRVQAGLMCIAVMCGLSGVRLEGAELLVADRLSNRVYRYDEAGSLIGILIDDPVHLSEPNGMALSPDGQYLYVASRQSNTVVRYDYHGVSATNPTVVIDEGLAVPASLQFSADEDTLYVSNLGFAFDGATVGQFDPSGAVAGDPLGGWLATGRTGLALDPNGQLLVGTFQDGSVLRLNDTTNAFELFIGPNQFLTGVGNLLVHDNALYVTAGLSGFVFKYDAETGALDPSFVPPSGLPFPASISLAPSGDSFLVGVLGLQDGTGGVVQFGFDGAFLDAYAEASADSDMGFLEATGLLMVDTDPMGDFDGDGHFDVSDIDSLVSEIAKAEGDVAFDLNGDGVLDRQDIEAWLTIAGEANLGAPYILGDANLDGHVSELDLQAWNAHIFTEVAQWAAGDFDANGIVDGSDFNIWNANRSRSSLPAAVPEPSCAMACLVLLGVWFRYQVGRSNNGR